MGLPEIKDNFEKHENDPFGHLLVSLLRNISEVQPNLNSLQDIRNNPNHILRSLQYKGVVDELFNGILYESSYNILKNSFEVNPDWEWIQGKIYNLYRRLFCPNPELKKLNAGNRSIYWLGFHEYKKFINNGAYGYVFSALNILENPPRQVAIKSTFDIFTSSKSNHEYFKRLYREMVILDHLGNHSNIVQLYDIASPLNYNDFNQLSIAMELMETNLKELIQENPGELQDDHIRYFMYQLLRGLKFVHSAGIVHRDLKPDNILINSDCDLKICDFGLSRCINIGDSKSVTRYVVTRYYRAPEILCQVETAEPFFTSDIWSAGCVFAELLLRGLVLFKGVKALDQVDKIVNILGVPNEKDFVGDDVAYKYIMKKHGNRNIPPDTLRRQFGQVNPEAYDLLEKMLVWNPNHRLSAAQALKHPYFKNLHVERDEPNAHPLNYHFEKVIENPNVDMKRIMYDFIMEYNYKKYGVYGDAKIVDEFNIE